MSTSPTTEIDWHAELDEALTWIKRLGLAPKGGQNECRFQISKHQAVLL
jgi:hypothetical protein